MTEVTSLVSEQVWAISGVSGSASVLRMEGLYQRLLMPDDESGNAFRLVIGLGTRFGKSKSSTAEVPSTQ